MMGVLSIKIFLFVLMLSLRPGYTLYLSRKGLNSAVESPLRLVFRTVHESFPSHGSSSVNHLYEASCLSSFW